MPKVINKYERFISSEDEVQVYNAKDEVQVYNARDAFLYGQTLMLKREREEGLQEGRIAGIEEGRRKEQIAIARSLKNAGIDIKIISENTGLSIEEVSKL